MTSFLTGNQIVDSKEKIREEKILSAGNKEVPADLDPLANVLSGDKKPEDVGAYLYQLYTPIFMNRMQTLSSKALRRVMLAIVLSPFNKVPIEHPTKEEKELVAIGTHIIDAKFLMITGAITAAQQEFTENQINEELEQPTQEITNG